MDHLPPDFSDLNRYYEPFLGAGSLFFRLKPLKATLSDNNKELIDCYKAVKTRPILLSKYLYEYLKKMKKANNKEQHYYEIRKKYNKIKKFNRISIAKAALFILLNKTCFNGIWRVNQKEEFNVPYGKKDSPSLPKKEDLISISKALSNVSLFHRDYKEVLKYARKGDLIYFDPPYPPLNGTSYFRHYTKKIFDWEDHENLSIIVNKLHQRGCNIMVSNADIPIVRKLYRSFNIHEKEVTRVIKAKGKRIKVKEVVIVNY